MSYLDFYFETSAYNFIADKLNIYDTIATKAYQSLKGNRYLISPLTVWEVLLNGSDDKREQLVYFSQHLFHNKLLRTPSELVIDYIYELIYGQVNSKMFTESNIGFVWTDLCQDSRKTFVFDKEILIKRSKLIQHISKNLRKIISDTIIINEEDIYRNEISLLRELVNIHFNSLRIDKISYLSRDRIIILKTAILFIYLLLYLELDFENGPVIHFWRKIRIVNDSDKINFLIKLSRRLLDEGPFVYMALMAYSQMQQSGKLGRGVVFDSLHTLYIPYADYLLTNDNHFIKFSPLINKSNGDKIKLIREQDWSFSEMDIVYPNI